MNGEELRDLLIRYVEHRKLLGYRYTHGGGLTRFVQDHAIEHPGESIKAKEVLEWVTRVHRAPPTQVAILSALRGFLRFVKAIDPATSVPDNHLLPSPRRNPPYTAGYRIIRLVRCKSRFAPQTEASLNSGPHPEQVLLPLELLRSGSDDERPVLSGSSGTTSRSVAIEAN